MATIRLRHATHGTVRHICCACRLKVCLTGSSSLVNSTSNGVGQLVHCDPCDHAVKRPCDKQICGCRKQANAQATSNGASSDTVQSRSTRAVPSDAQIGEVLRQVQLGPLLDRVTANEGKGLDSVADWASILSLGEQQRLAFARYLQHPPCIML